MTRRTKCPPRAAPYACIEPLESRIAPASVTTPTEIVSTLKDITNSTHTTGSLRDALYLADNATGLTDIVFEVTSHGKETPLHGIIALNSTLGALPAITNDVNIIGPGITINAGGKLEGLSITGDNSGISISGLTITNGSASAGGDLSITGGVNISLTGVKLSNGKGATGAGLYIDDSGATITITKSVITGNHAIGAAGATSAGYAGEGGGIANLAGTLIIQGSSKITHNTATGGAGAAGGYAGAAGAGGGIFNTGTLTITSATISGNTATGGNGGAGIGYSYSAKTQSATTATAGGDGGDAYGGGIANSGGTVTIQKSVISGNSAHGGAGMSGGKAGVGANGTAFTVTNGSTYAAGDGAYGGNGMNGGNGGNAVGGGVGSNGPGSVTLTQSTVSGNVATSGHGGNGSAGGKGGNGGAGGTYNGTTYAPGNGGNGGYGGNGGSGGLAAGGGVYCSGALTIQKSTLSGNTIKAGKAGVLGAGGAAGTGYNGGGTAGSNGTNGTYLGARGGGVDSESGTVFLSDSTVAKNIAPFGGGVSVYADTSAAIHNCTIAFNTATNATGGGGLFITLDSNNDPVNVVSTIIAMNTGTNIDGTLGTASSNNLTSGNPLLGTLAFHASGSTISTGATQTMLPSEASPAVAGGPGLNPDGLGTDQNGHAFGSFIEIGAVQTAS
jgi:hypothetical protein